MDAELREVLVDGTYPLKLSWTRTNQPTHITIGRIRKASGETLNLASAVSLDWNYNNAGEIQINSVVGLSPSPSSKYYINLLILTK
jgi:hypothetical protein